MFQQAALSCIETYNSLKIDVYGYSMDEVIEDIEITRQLLEYDSISFLAFSYGTMLAQLYAQKYDSLVNKMVLIGARPLNKFLFEEGIYKEQIATLYKQYLEKKGVVVNDSIHILLNEFELLLTTIHKNIKGINPYRFYFFGFSKLYTAGGIDKLFNVYTEACKGNSDGLLHSYKEFFKNFPGEIVLGDMVFKKQGMVISDTFQKDKKEDSGITQYANIFYTPKIKLRASLINEEYKINYDSNQKSLIILGESDIASPQSYFNKLESINCILIPNAGHLDIFNHIDAEILNQLF